MLACCNIFMKWYCGVNSLKDVLRLNLDVTLLAFFFCILVLSMINWHTQLWAEAAAVVEMKTVRGTNQCCGKWITNHTTVSLCLNQYLYFWFRRKLNFLSSIRSCTHFCPRGAVTPEFPLQGIIKGLSYLIWACCIFTSLYCPVGETLCHICWIHPRLNKKQMHCRVFPLASAHTTDI